MGGVSTFALALLVGVSPIMAPQVGAYTGSASSSRPAIHAESGRVRLSTAIRVEPTNAVEAVNRKTPCAILMALHDELGMTWEQIARELSVSRRSVHFWLRGGRMSPRNEEHIFHLGQILERVRVAGLDQAGLRARFLRSARRAGGARHIDRSNEINRQPSAWS